MHSEFNLYNNIGNISASLIEIVLPMFENIITIFVLFQM